MLRTSIKHNKGVTAVEYGLIGALLSVVIIGSVALTGIRTKEVFCYIATHISEVVNVDNGGICSAGSGDSNAGGNGSGGSDAGGSNSDGDGSGSTPDNTDTSHITFDSNGIPEDIDGSLTNGGFTNAGDNDNYAYAFIVKTLNALNEIDPIYSTYGLYTSQGTSHPVNTLNDTISLLNDNDNNSDNLYVSFGAFLSWNLLMEAQGVSGTVYKVGKDGTITEKDSGKVVLTGDQYCNGLPCSSIYSTTK